MDEGSSFDCQIWFPGAKSWELWVREKGRVEKVREHPPGNHLDFDDSIKSVRVLALPTSFQVAFPFLSNAMDSDGLFQTARMYIERQGSSFDAAGIMVEPIFGDAPNTIARIDAPLQKMSHEFNCDLPQFIVPAATIVSLKKNSISIWEELGDTVIAFEKNGKTIFYDKLSSGPSISDEVTRLQYQLQAGSLINSPEILSVRGERYRNAFEGHELFSGIETPPAPALLSRDYSLKPNWFRDELSGRDALLRKKRRSLLTGFSIGLLASLGLVLLVVSLLQTRKLNRELAGLLPASERVLAIQTRWEEVATAVDPQKSYLETWRNLFSLPGISGVAITRLDIDRGGMEVSGTSSSAKLALKFIEEVTTNEALAAFKWDYTPPEIDRSGTAKFELKGER